MSDIAVTGSELKKLLKLAKEKPVAFAFNPGKADADHLFAMNRRKEADVLSRLAKQEGPGNKVACGQCELSGKKLSLTCENALPGMAKKLKKYFKLNKLSMNIVILDPDGNTLESDIEDLGGKTELLGDGDDSGETDLAAGKWNEALAKLGPAIDKPLASGTGSQTKLKALWLLARQKAEDGDFDTALRAVPALIKLIAGARQDDVPDPRNTDVPAADPLAEKWLNAKAQLGPRIDAHAKAGNEIAGKLSEVWAVALQKAEAGDFASAMKAAQVLAKTIQKLPAQTASAGSEIPMDIVRKREFLITRWQQIPADLKVELDRLMAAIETEVPYENPGELRKAVENQLDVLISDMRTSIDEAVDKAINAGDGKYSAVSVAVGRLKGEVMSSEVIQALKDNTMTSGQPFETAFLSALDEVGTTLTS